MKHLALASALALIVPTAIAQPFDYQRQIGSSEYVHGADAEGMQFAPVTAGNWVPSLNRIMLESNVDGIAPNHFVGTITPSGPSRISLYEVQRDSPEGIAYRDYHERYPVGTDWDRVAREFRAQQENEGLAAEASVKGDAS